MNFILILGIALALAMDAFAVAVGVSLSLKKIERGQIFRLSSFWLFPVDDAYCRLVGRAELTKIHQGL